MLTGDKIQGFIEEQSDLGHGVRQTLEAMGFDPIKDHLVLAKICNACADKGKLRSAQVMMSADGAEDVRELGATKALALAAALEALLIGLSVGYGLGLREQETPFDD